MAQKDYVARGRSSARRKTSKGKAKKAQGSPMTTLVVAVGIVVLFVGGLFYITQNKKESPKVREAIHHQYLSILYRLNLKNAGAILKS